jgi:hypothetical protein
VEERLPQHLRRAVREMVVRAIEAAVVQVTLNELNVFPRAVQEDSRQREVRDSE